MKFSSLPAFLVLGEYKLKLSNSHTLFNSCPFSPPIRVCGALMSLAAIFIASLESSEQITLSVTAIYHISNNLPKDSTVTPQEDLVSATTLVFALSGSKMFYASMYIMMNHP